MTTTTNQRFALMRLSLVLMEFCLLYSGDAFLPQLPQNHLLASVNTPRGELFRLFALPDIKDMKLKDMRSELESYGISTRSFLEKTEFVNALQKARAEGLKPKNDSAYTNSEPKKDTSSNYSKANTDPAPKNGSQKSTTGTANNQAQSSAGTSRAERLKAETEKAKSMRVSELKQKLKDMGVDTKSFFEKTEFVRAYAEAVVDGVNGAGSGSKAPKQEEYDPEYRDVVMQKFDPQSQQRYLLGGTIIDIKLKK
jgi:hypothetical protein